VLLAKVVKPVGAFYIGKMTASRSPAKRNAVKRKAEDDAASPKAKWTENFKPAGKFKPEAKRERGKKKTKPDHVYQISWNPERETWDIDLDGKGGGVFAYDKGTAIALAIRDAKHDHGEGALVHVMIQQKDGSFKIEWSR